MMLEQIRDNERKSHIAMYTSDTLYEEGGWLRKPIKTVTDLFPYFEDFTELHVLDLGCGVGRNCISIAQQFRSISCVIDCIDILDFAVAKLNDNAKVYGVSGIINGIVSPIEKFPIPYNRYDWILAVSALEHMDSKASFLAKLEEIRNGTRKNGIVCLVINSDVQEFDKATGEPLPAQFEVNLPTKELQSILAQVFAGWEVVKTTLRQQQYDIPRETVTSDLRTNVVTFVARK